LCSCSSFDAPTFLNSPTDCPFYVWNRPHPCSAHPKPNIGDRTDITLQHHATSRLGAAHELPLALPVQPQNDKQIDFALIRSFKSAFEAITSTVQPGFDPAQNQGSVHFKPIFIQLLQAQKGDRIDITLRPEELEALDDASLAAR
jgi:hypothetical protein